MKLLNSAVIAVCASMSIAANATLIDFNTIASGVSVTTIGDAHFSLAGSGEMGAASTASISGSNYLWNSIDGTWSYPTNSIIKVLFDSTVTDLSFDFNNWGGKATTWSIFDSTSALIATGGLVGDSSIHSYDLSAYSGVRSIQFNNGGNDWSFGLNKLSYDGEEIPEPGALSLAALGLAGIAAFKRRKA